MYADNSDSHNPKGVTASALKTYCGGAGVPSGTSGQVIVYDGSNAAQAVNMSGHVAINQSGATTRQNNVVNNAMVAAGAAIAKSKLAALDIADADVAAGANIAKSKLASLNIVNGDVDAGANIAGSKIDPQFGAQNVEFNSGQAFYLGDSGTDGSWRMRINGTKIVWEKRETGSWNEQGSFDSA